MVVLRPPYPQQERHWRIDELHMMWGDGCSDNGVYKSQWLQRVKQSYYELRYDMLAAILRNHHDLVLTDREVEQQD